MLDRVGSYAADLLSTQQILQQKATLDNTLTQTTSGKISQDYTGVANVADNTLNLEAQDSSIDNFTTNNAVVNTKLSAMAQVYTSIQTTMQQFQQQLESYIDNSEQSSVTDTQNLQAFAFQALKNMEYYLNTSVGGQYLFGGSDTNEPPVQLNAATLQDFQSQYDGYNVSVPTSRAADLTNTATNVLDTGSFTFNDQAGTITAANTGQFGSLPVGSAVTIDGSGSQDGTYTILSNDGTTLGISKALTNEGGVQITDVTNPSASTDSTLGVLGFDSSGVISSNAVNPFGNFQVGDQITVSGATNPANNGTFTITNIGPNTVSLNTSALVDETEPPATTISTAADAPTDPGFSVKSPVIFTNPGLMTSTTRNAFVGLNVGDSIAVTGATNAANNGSFVISGITTDPNTGLQTLAISRPDFAAPADNIQADANDSLSTVTWPLGANTQTADTTQNPAFALSFTPPTPGLDATISDVGSDQLAGVSVGNYITVAGANNPANNGTYRVTANNGGVLSVQAIQATSVTDEDASTTAVISNNTATTFTPGNLTFSASGSTIIGANAGSLSSLAVNQTVHITGSQFNDGPLVVTGTYNTPVASEDTSTETSLTPSMVLNGKALPLTGSLNFTANSATPLLSSSNLADLANVQVGDVLTVSGTSANNGQFVVTANNGGVLTLALPGTAVKVAKNESLSTTSYYQGNTQTSTQNVDTNTPLSFGVTASDAAFEKGIRAMAEIAQGALGTAGGLDMNFSRLQTADYLITSAIDGSQQGPSPSGTIQGGAAPSGNVELPSNVSSLLRNLDLEQSTMSNVSQAQTATQNLDETTINGFIDANPTQTIVQLLDQQAALQASYQALSTVRQTSLLNYLK